MCSCTAVVGLRIWIVPLRRDQDVMIGYDAVDVRSRSATRSVYSIYRYEYTVQRLECSHHRKRRGGRQAGKCGHVRNPVSIVSFAKNRAQLVIATCRHSEERQEWVVAVVHAYRV